VVNRRRYLENGFDSRTTRFDSSAGSFGLTRNREGNTTMDPRCETCRFWTESADRETPTGEQDGGCHYNIPSVAAYEDDGYSYIRESVSTFAKDWCRHHELRESTLIGDIENISQRTRNALCRDGITSLESFGKKTERELSFTRNLGDGGVLEVMKLLCVNGINLKDRTLAGLDPESIELRFSQR